MQIFLSLYKVQSGAVEWRSCAELAGRLLGDLLDDLFLSNKGIAILGYLSRVTSVGLPW